MTVHITPCQVPSSDAATSAVWVRHGLSARQVFKSIAYLKDAKKLLIFLFQSSSGEKDQTYLWIIVWMDMRHITHHSASAANACQQGNEKWSQKHPTVVNSNLLGQNQAFHPEKLWLTLWLIMLWRKPKGILTPAATPHLLVCWRPGRGRQYQGFVMRWIPTAGRKQPVTCSDNKLNSSNCLLTWLDFWANHLRTSTSPNPESTLSKPHGP